jgi:hypothetical protein
MKKKDTLTEQDHANIATYHHKTLWNEAITMDYLTPQQVAEIYHVTPTSVRNWVKAGWLEADIVYGRGAKVGRYRISPLILEEMDKQREQIIEESKRYWMRVYVKLGMKRRR